MSDANTFIESGLILLGPHRTTFCGSFRREHERNLSPIAQPILTLDAFDMAVHRALGDVQLVCNLLVQQTAPDQPNHVMLAWSGRSLSKKSTVSTSCSHR